MTRARARANVLLAATAALRPGHAAALALLEALDFDRFAAWIEVTGVA